MSFFAVLLALVIEQARPLPRTQVWARWLADWVQWNRRHFEAGRRHHRWVAWGVSVLAPVVLTVAVYLAVRQLSLLLALALDVAVLYATLGFRQFSHYFTDIRDALDRGDEQEARRLVSQWRGVDSSDWPRAELLRHVVEESILGAHRHVFGVFFCFVVFSAVGLGPAGAVLYRLAELVQRHWHRAASSHGVVPSLESVTSPDDAGFATDLFRRIDHVPARLTAFGFAVVGNFEEAINSWRRDAHQWPEPNEGIVLAAAAGAVGVQLGVPVASRATPTLDVEDQAAGLGSADATGSAPPLQFGHLHSMVGLVWRSVVLWMLLLALLTLANVVG